MQKIDFTVPIIDNFGDMGFSLQLAIKLLRKNKNLSIRFWSEDENLFHKMMDGIKISDENSRLTYHQLSHFQKAKKSKIRFNFFGYPLTDENLIGTSICINFDYLQFRGVPHSLLQPSSTSLHGTEYYQNGAKIIHFVPGIIPGIGGIHCKLLSEGFIGKKEKSMIDEYYRCTEMEALPMQRQKVGIFVYSETFSQLLPLMEELSEIDFYVLGRNNLEEERRGKDNEGSDSNHEEIIHSNTPNSHIHFLPFLGLEALESVILDCDRSIIRGENSLSLALATWTPFLWDIYRELNGAHLDAMSDFIKAYSKNIPEVSEVLMSFIGVNSWYKEDFSVHWKWNVKNFFLGKYDSLYPKKQYNEITDSPIIVTALQTMEV